MNFKVEFRKDCKLCGASLPKRFRTYCSKPCRDKATRKKWQPHNSQKQREKYDRFASIPDPDKKQCLICDRWYIQVGSHIKETHKYTAREYREEFDLPLKRGITPKWYQQLKGEQALENKTFLNLKQGKKYWFKKDDPRAKVTKGWKGRAGSKGYGETDYY